VKFLGVFLYHLGVALLGALVVGLMGLFLVALYVKMSQMNPLEFWVTTGSIGASVIGLACVAIGDKLRR
jgi:hypothetical protein